MIGSLDYQRLQTAKWDRADYRDRTIAKAIESAPERYQGVSAESNGQPEDERNTSSISDEQDVPQGDVTLETVIETFRDWLDLPDAGFIEVLLATYAANQIPGDPVWLLLSVLPVGARRSHYKRC